jgi:hypothetical protein
MVCGHGMNAESVESVTRFYRDALGAEETTVTRWWVPTWCGSSSVTPAWGVFDAKDGPRPGVPHHTFDFEGPRDPNAMVQELEAKGIKVETVRMHGSGPGYSVWC